MLQSLLILILLVMIFKGLGTFIIDSDSYMYHEIKTIAENENITFSNEYSNENESLSNDNHSSNKNTEDPGENMVMIAYLPTIITPMLDPSFTHFAAEEIQHLKPEVILLGTKWCGEGNKARKDVGILYRTDECCRNHDKCPYYILTHEKKYDLYNNAHFTRLHCDCDAYFYDCLKKNNSPFSNAVGIAYFNILRAKCFRFEYPVIMCSQTAGWFTRHCIEYVVDTNKPKKWQWFDNHEF